MSEKLASFKKEEQKYLQAIKSAEAKGNQQHAARLRAELAMFSRMVQRKVCF